MSMTFVDLYSTELDRVLSTSAQSTLFTEARRKAAINAAAQWFTVETECLRRVVEVTLANNSDGIDLLDSANIAAQDFLFIAKSGPEIEHTNAAGTVTTVAGKDFERTSVEMLNRDQPGWRQADSSLPSSWYLEDDGTTFLRWTPAIKLTSGESAIVRVPYVFRPAEMVADADVPFTATNGDAKTSMTPWYDGIVLKAASELEYARKDLDRSNLFMQQAQAQVANYLDKQRAPGGKRVQFKRRYYKARTWQGQRAVRETETA